MDFVVVQFIIDRTLQASICIEAALQASNAEGVAAFEGFGKVIGQVVAFKADNTG
jgi:hypothetical protein